MTDSDFQPDLPSMPFGFVFKGGPIDVHTDNVELHIEPFDITVGPRPLLMIALVIAGGIALRRLARARKPAA